MRLRRRRPSWWLENADVLHAEAPRSFFIPPIEHRQGIAIGRVAKLLFAIDPPHPDGTRAGGERMWVEVTERHDDGTYAGALVNEPRAVTGLSYGDRIEFGPEHVISLWYTEEELGYSPGDPAVVDARIIREDIAPVQLMRAQPPGESRFVWFAALEAGPPQNRLPVTLGDLTDRWPELAAVFSATGDRWARRPGLSEYRRI